MLAPPHLAYLSKLAAHSLICAKLPGLLSTASVCMVCMESMTTRSGWVCSICTKICSSDVSVSTSRSLPPRAPPCPTSCDCSRSALSLSWRALSSPLTYSTRRPARRRTVCSTSVLLPMPGSPPSSTRLPGTSPPPNTRLSSRSPISMRGSSSARISATGTGRAFCALSCPAALRAALAAPAIGFSSRMTSSFMVFHCWHEGQRPTQRRLSCPQFSHTYTFLSLAIIHIYLEDDVERASCPQHVLLATAVCTLRRKQVIVEMKRHHIVLPQLITA